MSHEPELTTPGNYPSVKSVEAALPIRLTFLAFDFLLGACFVGTVGAVFLLCISNKDAAFNAQLAWVGWWAASTVVVAWMRGVLKLLAAIVKRLP
jgi:hypothetical protein